MLPQVYVIFELGSFFQNFRRYVRSYDGTRMHDGANSGSPVSACAPFAYIDSNNDSLPINPCGQIAQSFFNDTFSLSLAGGGQLQVDDSDIAWSSDANHLYGPVAPENFNPAGGYPRGGNTTDLVLNQNQHWMVRGCGRSGCRFARARRASEEAVQGRPGQAAATLPWLQLSVRAAGPARHPC